MLTHFAVGNFSKIKQVEIKVTFECNWNCYYCAENTHCREPIDFNLVLQNIEKYKDFKIILSGGEPGLLTEAQWKSIFKIKDSNLELNTNGTFLKRYPQFVNKFDKINYHCSEDLDSIDFRNFGIESGGLKSEISKMPKNIEYLIIVTDSNFHKLEAFLNKYKSINFNVIACNMNFDNYKSFKNFYELYNIIKNKNVLAKAKYAILTGKDLYADTLYI